MRAIWTGAISFGLINIPVKLYSATAGTELKFHYLHKTDLGPIRYARICREDGKEIPYEEIVRGYEYQPGDFVVLTEEDFNSVNIKKSKTIDITAFTEEEEIDTIYFEKPYYLEPDKGAEKPYALLREALAKTKKVGVAKFVLRNREHLAILKPRGQAVVLEQLRYDSELRTPAGLKLPTAEEAREQEIEMAIKLIDQLKGHFVPEDYQDTYTAELQDVIAKKAKGLKPKVKAGQTPQPTAAKDLMATLKASLEQAQK